MKKWDGFQKRLYILPDSLGAAYPHTGESSVNMRSGVGIFKPQDMAVTRGMGIESVNLATMCTSFIMYSNKFKNDAMVGIS